MSAARSPIFVVSHQRTGSTLMRFVIDTHPEVCCPPEIALGKLCAALTYTIGLTIDEALVHACGGDRKRAIRAEVRRHIEDIMDGYCAAKKKTRWCDRSTHNVEYLRRLVEIFPDARFVCLHRNGLDVVHSMLELCRYGFPGRTGELVARSPANVLDALVTSWAEASARLLAFEAAHPERCLRVTYEQFVSETETVVRRLCAFLGLAYAPEMVSGALSAGHDPGPGDPKIRFTSSILTSRVGKGAAIPLRQIAEERLAVLNSLHRQLGYAEVSHPNAPCVA